MKTFSRAISATVLLGQAACASMDAPADDMNTDSEAVVDDSAAGHNGLGTYNLIHATILADQKSATPLTSRALDTKEVAPVVKSDICNDGTSSEAFKYLVECALTSDHDVVVSCPGEAPRHYTGRQGVSNGWSSGACDETCRQRVSACMIGLTNFRSIDGVKVNLVGNPGVFHPTPDAVFKEFSVEEGTYWGDVFNLGRGQEINGCRSNESGDLLPTPTLQQGLILLPAMHRVCADFASNYPVCRVCDRLANERVQVCDSTDRKDYFLNVDAKSEVPMCNSVCRAHPAVSGRSANNTYWTDCKVPNDANSSNTVTIYRSK